jgi:hypothetical protein
MNARPEIKGANEETDNDHYSFAFEDEDLVRKLNLKSHRSQKSLKLMTTLHLMESP